MKSSRSVMELCAVWGVILVLQLYRVTALLPIPLIILEETVELDTETRVTCVLPAAECRCSEVELKIVTREKLKNCVSHKGDNANVTCALHVTRDMNGMEISCEAHYKTKSKPYKMHIQTEPEFTDCPDALVWLEGEETRFQCGASGFPSPTVTCERNNTLYRNGATFTATRNMSGEYVCRATNFDTVTKRVTVSVEYEPRMLSIVVQPAMPVQEGVNITLTCEADAVPPPTYSWHPQTPHVTFHRDNRTIQIRQVTSAHEGFYICIAQNKHGIQTLQERIVLDTGVIEARTDPVLSVGRNGGDKMAAQMALSWMAALSSCVLLVVTR